MAEVTAFRNNALPYPVYGVPWTIVFPLLDADGDPVTGATCDSEISKNGDTGADCTNEGTEIAYTTATNKGMYYLTLTAAEMTADIVAVTIYSATSKATCVVLYPRKLVTLASGTSQGGAVGYITLAAATVAFDGQYNGCLCVATIDGNVEARILQACTSSNQQCTVTPNWNVEPDSDDTYVIYLPEGMQIPQANAVAISTDKTAADNLEAILDGTGGTGLKVNSIENTGNTTLTGTTTLTGAVSLGSTLGITGAVTLSSTLAVDAVTFASLAVTGAITAASATINNPSGAAVTITGTTIGVDINASAGIAVDIDGTTGAITADASAGNAVAFTSASAGGHGLVTTGFGTGRGFYAVGGSGGAGIYAVGGDTTPGIHAVGGANGNGLYAQGGATAGSGIYAVAPTSGGGVTSVGAGTGSGLTVSATGSGNGISASSVSVAGTTTLTGAVSLGSTLGITGAVTLSSTLGVGAVTFASATVSGALLVSGTTTLTGAVSAPAGITADITGNLIGTVSILTTYTGNTPQTGDVYAQVGAPVGASISADIAAVKAETVLIVADTGELQTDWHDGGRLDVILDAAGGAADPLLNAVPGAYGAGTAGEALGDIAAILADTNELQTNQGAWATATNVTVSDKTGFSLANTGLDAVTAWTVNITGNLSGSIGSVGTGGITAASIADAAIDNATFAADVGSTVYASNIIALAVNKALANYDPPTKTEMDSGHALLSTAAKLLDYVQLLARKDDAIVTDNAVALAEINANEGSGAGDYAPEEESLEGDHNLIYNMLVDIEGSGFNTATDSLIKIRDRGDAAWITATGFSTHSADDVVSALGTGTTLTELPWNAAWDAEVQSEVTDAMTDWGAPPTAAAIRAEIDSNSTQLALIVADTGELQTDWADGGRLDTLLDSAAADEWATDLPGTYTSGQAGYIIGTNIDGQISTIADTVGAGAYSVTVTVKSAAGSALEHASVWVSSDAAGATTVAGTLLTTAVGQVTFRLNTGTYYFWKQLAGHVFTNPESQTVDGTETFTFTATGTATAASDWKFSVTTLTAHLVGIVNQDYNADGTAPARFIRLVRDAAIDLWYTRDWRFRRKFGTLTTVASQAYAVMGTGLPSDFDKIDWKWLRETADSSNDTGVRIRFTEDSADLLAVRDKFSTTHGGAPPQVAFFVHDTSQDDFCWRVEFAPTPDKVYTYRLPYLKLDPWTLGDVGNDDFPSVPRWWFKLWEANAKWQIQQAFRLDKEWMDTKRDFEAALAACVENKQETVSSPPDTIDPGYADDPGLFGAEGTGTDPDWAPS